MMCERCMVFICSSGRGGEDEVRNCFADEGRMQIADDVDRAAASFTVMSCYLDLARRLRSVGQKGRALAPSLMDKY